MCAPRAVRRPYLPFARGGGSSFERVAPTRAPAPPVPERGLPYGSRTEERSKRPRPSTAPGTKNAGASISWAAGAARAHPCRRHTKPSAPAAGWTRPLGPVPCGDDHPARFDAPRRPRLGRPPRRRFPRAPPRRAAGHGARCGPSLTAASGALPNRDRACSHPDARLRHAGQPGAPAAERRSFPDERAVARSNTTPRLRRGTERTRGIVAESRSRHRPGAPPNEPHAQRLPRRLGPRRARPRRALARSRLARRRRGRLRSRRAGHGDEPPRPRARQRRPHALLRPRRAPARAPSRQLVDLVRHGALPPRARVSTRVRARSPPSRSPPPLVGA